MNLLRMGCDLDGVVAEWNTAFVELIKQECGIDVDTTPPWPTVWQWPKQHLTSKQVSKLWDWVRANPWWWRMLATTNTGVKDLRLLEQLSREGHAVHFITSRPGIETQRQTAIWLAGHGVTYPTVLLANNADAKADLCKGLRLDLMIDDKPENVYACQDVGTRTFLRRQPYNREFLGGDQADSVTDMWNQVLAEGREKAA